jgi:hypothetical protein
MELAMTREALHSEREASDTAGADDRLIERKEDGSGEDDIANDEPVELDLSFVRDLDQGCPAASQDHFRV